MALACWLAAAWSSVAIEHAHAANVQTHGFGWLTLASDAVRNAPGSSGERHRHRVVFGVEMPAESCEPTPTIDASVIDGAETPFLFDDLSFPLDLPIDPTTTKFLKSEIDSAPVPALVPIPSVSHFALRTASGVQLI